MRPHPSVATPRKKKRLRTKPRGGRAPTGANIHWPRSKRSTAAHSLPLHPRKAGVDKAWGRARLSALYRGSLRARCLGHARCESRPRFAHTAERKRTRALPAVPRTLKRCTSRPGHNAGGVVTRTRPGADCVGPPAGTALAPHPGAPSRLRPSMGEIRCRYHDWRRRQGFYSQPVGRISAA